MAACWKHDISRNEGEELPTLWRQRGGQHVWNVCHINEGKTILAVACRPSILRCPPFTSSCWAQQKQQSFLWVLLGLLTNDEKKKKVLGLPFAFYVSFFFHCFMFSRLFGERVSNVWIQTSLTAVFKRNHKMWIKNSSRKWSFVCFVFLAARCQQNLQQQTRLFSFLFQLYLLSACPGNMTRYIV